MTKTKDLEKLQALIETFVAERNWREFHTPKNLAMALSVECAELLEIFQWLTPDQSRVPGPDAVSHIGEEIGDIMIYLTMLAAAFNLDPVSAGIEKMRKNETKHQC